MSRLIIRTKGKTIVVNPLDVLYCKASGSYSVLFLNNSVDELCTSVNLSCLQRRMESLSYMVRVSKSLLVNIGFVECIHHSPKEIELKNGERMPFTMSISALEEVFNT
ncbi:LytTR family transcriptional regulator DNA-binding domain-containing protein [Parapedobacter flavus]|uniref:LytTR family transcriptional regulator DNA-binding domain-containing protein n=1 Tax=Parapedobacter flavus TaxID=3110225 RepID=UPI003F516EEC